MTDNNLKNILVTGANGHIGAHVVRQLLEQGYKVRGFVRPGSDRRGLEGLDIELFEGDVMNREQLVEAARDQQAIIHLAAVYKTIAKTAEEIVAPAIQGAENVFAAAHAQGIQRIVYTSSIASIGFSYHPNDLRTGRDWNNDASNPYYVAKTQSEKKAQKLAEQTGIHLVVICPAVVLGSLDYRITPSNQLIQDWLNGIGQTYPGGLNLVDVRDVAAAHVAALTKGENRHRYVVASDNMEVKAVGHMLRELTGIKPVHLPFERGLLLWSAKWTERVCRLFNVKPPFTYDLVFEAAGRYGWFDTTETNQTFGLQPHSSREAVIESIRWLADQDKLKPKVANKAKARLATC
ncbi:MAG: NAD-dependent epimerase/dehydratase family protein [Marinobacter sp.]|nr:NAD-dependent epimerase/dehydratase family protein [Marinobacter sp.]